MSADAAQKVYTTAVPKYLSVAAVAQRFGVSKMTIYRELHEHRFPGAIRVGRSVRIPAEALHAYERSNLMDAWERDQ